MGMPPEWVEWEVWAAWVEWAAWEEWAAWVVWVEWMTWAETFRRMQPAWSVRHVKHAIDD